MIRLPGERESMKKEGITIAKFYHNPLQFGPGTPVNTTATSELSPEMKEFYDTHLIELVGPYLVHDQFGQEENIPKGRGKTIEFRGFKPLPKALTPLTEGVTPDGTKMQMFTKRATLNQYGAYVPLTDLLELTALDPMILRAEDAIGQQAGETLDTITREVINAGTNVQYAEGQVSSRATLAGTMKLTVKALKLAVRTLKKKNAPRIKGNYCAIINPDVAFDLTEDPEYKEQIKYTDNSAFKNGFLYRQWGIEFYESTEAKIFAKAGASQQDVYSTLVIGQGAYGVSRLSAARDGAGRAMGRNGIEMIVHQRGEAGSSDPLNQRSTVGWKATKAVCMLVDEYMVRIETGSSFNDHEAN